MSESNEKPLVTFIVCGYNQERFVREAVEAAFAQTYSPLQIVLSDDCSKDRTFEIMREFAAAYRGPHQVVLNRMPSNLGIARHFNRIMELAQGQLVICSAGDDISLPNRAEAIYQAWERSGRKATGIQSAFTTIDDEGNAFGGLTNGAVTKRAFGDEMPALENYALTLKPGILGAAFAFTANVFATFGPLPEALIHEDSVIGLRALCLGQLMFIDEPLVKRRIHGNNLYSRHLDTLATTREAIVREEARAVRDAKNRAVMYDVFLSDLRTARSRGLISPEQWTALEKACLWRRRVFSYQTEFPDAGVPRKFGILFAAWRDGADQPILKWMAMRAMPSSMFQSLKLAGNSLRSTVNRPAPSPERGPASASAATRKEPT
jgi:glycosyltransferase involved in cell wall biosynthesis